MTADQLRAIEDTVTGLACEAGYFRNVYGGCVPTGFVNKLNKLRDTIAAHEISLRQQECIARKQQDTNGEGA